MGIEGTTVGVVVADYGRGSFGKPEKHLNEALLAVESWSAPPRLATRLAPTACSNA
jgi:hypothetical protein